jgi:hypothetical protein
VTENQVASAHADARLSAEGPFATGQDPGVRPAAVLAPSVTAPPFRQVTTHQGVVTASGDAEWHLVRTAARIRSREQHGFPGAYPPDLDDRRTLADALGGTCGLTSTEILGRLAPQIAARVTEIERGPAAAAGLGREHGHAGTQPYCDLDTDGDATPLLRAFGETEWMTDANCPHRLALVTAYAQAYRQASAQGPPAATPPARIAARDFPQHTGQPTQGGAPAAPGPASQAPAKPGTRPRRGPA